MGVHYEQKYVSFGVFSSSICYERDALMRRTVTHQWIVVYNASRRRYGTPWHCCCQTTVQ